MNPARRLRVMLTYLFAALATVAGVNVLVNPYGIWPLTLVDKIYFDLDPGVDRLKAPYRVRSEQPTTLLVGSSRISYGMPIEQGCRDGVLNAGLSGASVNEIARVIAIARRGTRLQRVVWGLDFFAFQESFRGFRDEPTRARLDADASILVRDTVLSTRALKESWRLVSAAARGRQQLPSTALLPVPWPDTVIRDMLHQLESGPSPLTDRKRFERDLPAWVGLYADYHPAAAQLELLRDAIQDLESDGVEVILLVPPLHLYELESIRQTDRWYAFQDWKRQLATIAPYWDYSGYNDLARTDWLFTPACFCHFHPAVGHVILRQVFGGGCAQCGDAAQIILKAGVRVDRATVARHLDKEEALLRANVDPSSRPAQVISQVVHR